MTFVVIIVEMGLDTVGWCRAVGPAWIAAAPVCTLPLGERQFGAHVAAAAIRRLDANGIFDGPAVVGSADAEQRPMVVATHYLYCTTQTG